MFSHLHPSYWSLSEWSFLTDRSGSSWRSLEFWPGRPHLSCSACTEERTCVNCGWTQGRSVQTDDLRLDLTLGVFASLCPVVGSAVKKSHACRSTGRRGILTTNLSIQTMSNGMGVSS